MKKTKISLLAVTIVFLLCFVVSLFNPFRDDDRRNYEVDGYFKIHLFEREKQDADYLYAEINNISDEDVYNVELVFGNKDSLSKRDNYVWFRIAKIAKGDTVKLTIYEETGKYLIDSKKSTSNNDTYNIAIYSDGEFEVEDCLKIAVANVDSDVPTVYDINPGYWSWEKTLLLALTVIPGAVLAYLHFKKGKKQEA